MPETASAILATMRVRFVAIAVIGFASAGAAAHAAPPIELELATERGVQITAPQEWLQLLAGIGIEHVGFAAPQPATSRSAENRGTAEAAELPRGRHPHMRDQCGFPAARSRAATAPS